MSLTLFNYKATNKTNQKESFVDDYSNFITTIFIKCFTVFDNS